MRQGQPDRTSSRALDALREAIRDAVLPGPDLPDPDLLPIVPPDDDSESARQHEVDGIAGLALLEEEAAGREADVVQLRRECGGGLLVERASKGEELLRDLVCGHGERRRGASLFNPTVDVRRTTAPGDGVTRRCQATRAPCRLPAAGRP